MHAELGQRHVHRFQTRLHDVADRCIDAVFIHRRRTVHKQLEQFRQLNGFRARFQHPALLARIHITVPRQLFQQLAQLVVTHIDMFAELPHRQRAAGLLRRVEQQQDFQHIVETAARIEVAAESLALPVGQRSGQHRPRQHQRPQKMQPQQKKRHGGKRAVNRSIAVEPAHIPGKQNPRDFKAGGGQERPRQRLPRRYIAVRHETVHKPQHRRTAADGHPHFQPARQQRRRRFQTAAVQQAEQQRQPHAQRQRPERQQRPVHQKLHQQRPLRADAPNAVERAVHRLNQQQRRNHQHHAADGGQPAGLCAELVQIVEHHIRPLRHDGAVDKADKRVRPFVEHRKRRRNHHRHRQHRHQGQQRRKRQAGRHLRHAHLVKPPHHEPGESE